MAFQLAPPFKLLKAPPPEKAALTKLIHELRRRQATERRAGKPEVLWVADVPGVDPLSASESNMDAENVSIHGDIVAVTYGMKSAAHKYRLTAFSLESGKRQWDSNIEDDSPYSGLKVTPHHVLVSRWNGLYVFDIKTGNLAYKIP